MRLTVIGCSGSFPSPESPASCYLVEADDTAGRTWRVLLDLGNGALGSLQRLMAPAQVDAVLLSHLHADHCLDLCGLYVALRYDPAGRPAERTPVYGPTGTAHRLDAAYGVDATGGLDQVFDVREWQEAEPVRVGPLTVTPMQVDHPVEAYALRVEHEVAGRTQILTYTGDTDACSALVTLAKGSDILLAEASFVEGRDHTRHIHLTGLRAGQVATEAGVQRLLLTHLPVWNDPVVVAEEAAASFSGQVRVVRAGEVYSLDDAPAGNARPGRCRRPG